MKKQVKPWIDKKGGLKSSRQIGRISRKWDSEQWREYEQFLIQNHITRQSLWDVYLKRFERYQREETINPKRYDKLAATASTVNDFLGGKNDEVFAGKFHFFKPYIHLSMKTLSKREREVIRGIFMEEKTEVQLAKRFSISRSTVSHHKKTALSKMKQFLEEIGKEVHLGQEFVS